MNNELNEEQLDNFLGGAPKEEAYDSATTELERLKKLRGELTEKELDNYLGGIPQEESNTRHR